MCMIDSLTHSTYDKDVILCDANTENVYSTLHINAKSISIHQNEIDLTFDINSNKLERIQYLEINGVKFKRVS